MHSLADNLTPPETDFVDAVRFAWIAAIPHIIDQKDPHMGQRKKCFARPLLDQMWRRHHQAREWPAGTVPQYAAQSDKRLPCAAFGNYIGVTRQLPALAHPHY